jgi:cullin 3
LDKTITIFRFITEKDVFEKYYKGHLAKRLLLGRSVSDDAERGMLAKLKVESGVQFTQKMEGMFNDMKISAETTKDYHDYLSKTTVRKNQNGFGNLSLYLAFYRPQISN